MEVGTTTERIGIGRCILEKLVEDKDSCVKFQEGYSKFCLLLSISSFLFFLFFFHTHAATFEVRNNCVFTVWAAAVPGGGRQLNQTDVWTFEVKPDLKDVRIWARTNCSFDESGRGRCETGDCGGLLECQAYGTPPTTLAEYTSTQFNLFKLDLFDISLAHGFNVPTEFSPTSCRCTGGGVSGISCTADINRQCPTELRAPGGCNSPCTVFGSDRYCCTARHSKCGSTNYSRFFKSRCPHVYSYAKDGASSTFTCPGGTNYRVVFSAIFEVRNNCLFTVWAAVVPGDGRQLNQTDVWTLEMKPDIKGARIWARTNCNFDASGRGRCETGDCGGLLQCQDYGTPPNTLAEYLSYEYDITNLEMGDISLIDGFNVPIEFSPTSSKCSKLSCTADINRQCPKELRALGGCNNPCTVFGGDRYCCTVPDSSCGSTSYSRFFKNLCPNAYSYSEDIATHVFTCPKGTNYKYTVVFCP
ncbi:uncharacterized protein LOC111430220 [Cucurbita moschata]|uniref:Uncharacterized protein LOC111430220 n=1 Tax=Cucurbita moschata TaxID=3662 RepID=A0A6J1E5T0_CUCMO|nr:uncharacterized protein LOC111430220 [Cucurbita moschata]